jgi:hypothetical protein
MTGRKVRSHDLTQVEGCNVGHETDSDVCSMS